jgi:ABC-2 type transport system permease protein/lipopolysaccharide transport system permease protein
MTAATPDSWTGYAPLDADVGAQFQAATSDIREGLRRWRNWTYLAVENVKNRYRRTVLGPWWLTLQMGIFVTGMTIVFGHLLHAGGLREFLPYVAVGYIVFVLLVGLTNAATGVFVLGSSTLKSTRQPLSNLVLRDVGVEFIHFGHNLVLYLVFLVAGLVPLSPKLLIALPVAALIAVNGLFVGLWLGIGVARFRDVQPFINSILGVLIFFTPVFYDPRKLSSGIQIVVLAWNPFTYLIQAFRAPLIGAPLLPSYYIGTAVFTVINIVLGLVVFTRARSRLPYWVA